MSSKVRRKVTVDMGKSDESDKRKPSVFERLGPGGGQRKYEYDSDVLNFILFIEFKADQIVI